MRGFPGRSGSHYLVENGEPTARFNEREKAEAARAMYVAELTAMYERNAERFTSRPAEKEAVIKAYDTEEKYRTLSGRKSSG